MVMKWPQVPLSLALATGGMTWSPTQQQPLAGPIVDIPKFCGKPYQPGYPNVFPGGRLEPPLRSPTPMIAVQLQPRYTIYDSSERQGQFVVEVSVSHTHGHPLRGAPQLSDVGNEAICTGFEFEIRVEETGQLLVSASASIATGAELFTFEFGKLEPRIWQYNAMLNATVVCKGGEQRTTNTTDLYFLPAKNTGSTVKVDNLHGGMLVANDVTNYTFQPLLPFGFYTSCSGYLNLSSANVAVYKDMGFNSINPVCAFTDGDLGYVFDWMDEANVWYQYDMRGSYTNLSSVAEQIPLIKDRSSFLSWYTADEPDGWQHGLNSTRLAYDFLREQDPYHPVGLVLNCDNYYFEQYSAGSDYVLQDTYPIGIDPNFSRPWNTICNATYGDCGCDNCVGDVTDVSNRLDSYIKYQEWLGEWKKPLWSVLQAFHGEYWSRDPTAEESWAMLLLSFNHGAKGIVSWIFPTSDILSEAHSTFAKVATVPPVSTILLNADPMPVNMGDPASLDVAFWSYGMEVMVSIVNLGRADNQHEVTVELPFVADHIGSQCWGDTDWILVEGHQGWSLKAMKGLQGLSTSIVILATSSTD